MRFSNTAKVLGAALTLGFLGCTADLGFAQIFPVTMPPSPTYTQPTTTEPAPVVAPSPGVTPSSGATAVPSTSPPVTTFHCVTSDNKFATIARRGERTTPPMILWVDTSFGSQFPPERRCQIVSDRLTRAVATNGGKLSNLLLTFGEVNNLPVLCYVGSRSETCTKENLLLTLRNDDRGKEREILQQLITFSIQGKGRPTTRGPANAEPDPRNFANFGQEVDKAFNGTTTPGNSRGPASVPPGQPSSPHLEPQTVKSNPGTDI